MKVLTLLIIAIGLSNVSCKKKAFLEKTNEDFSVNVQQNFERLYTNGFIEKDTPYIAIFNTFISDTIYLYNTISTNTEKINVKKIKNPFSNTKFFKAFSLDTILLYNDFSGILYHLNHKGKLIDSTSIKNKLATVLDSTYEFHLPWLNSIVNYNYLHFYISYNNIFCQYYTATDSFSLSNNHKHFFEYNYKKDNIAVVENPFKEESKAYRLGKEIKPIIAKPNHALSVRLSAFIMDDTLYVKQGNSENFFVYKNEELIGTRSIKSKYISDFNNNFEDINQTGFHAFFSQAKDAKIYKDLTILDYDNSYIYILAKFPTDEKDDKYLYSLIAYTRNWKKIAESQQFYGIQYNNVIKLKNKLYVQIPKSDKNFKNKHASFKVYNINLDN
ncbi:MAG: hypothetical protein JXR60_09980 [Bacteroidales bacterium]|nr:hypothetical protein [Bacteroidales bacterium]